MMSIPAFPRGIAERTYDGFYTVPCPHSPMMAINKTRAVEIFKPRTFEWFEGLMISHFLEDCENFYSTKRVRFVLQQVINNPLGRWIACESQMGGDPIHDADKIMHVFLRRSCLNCVVDSVKMIIDRHEDERTLFWGIVIIPDMDDLEDYNTPNL